VKFGFRILIAVAEGSVSAILKSGDVTRTIEWYRRMGFDIRGVLPETGEPAWCE
jgi:5-enolpyruvylshikimate-3-phosphate synthase